MGWTLGDDADDDEEALLAAEGGKAQARVVLLLLRLSRRNAYFLPLQRETICVLHREAMSRLLPDAGELRTRSDLAIENSRHVVPPHAEVPRLIDEACVFVNAQPEEADPLFVAAYILWRICWIHPFDDGNGRTARAVSYLVLSQRLKMELGGEHPLPQRIKFAPIAYVHALEAADAAWLRGTLDVSNLRRLLEFYLEAQLRDDPPGLPPWV